MRQATKDKQIGNMTLSRSRHCEVTALNTWASNAREQRYVRERFQRLMGGNKAAVMHDALTAWCEAAHEQRTLLRKVSKIIGLSSVRCVR